MMQGKIPVLLLFLLPAVLFVTTSPSHAATDAVVCIEGVEGDSSVSGFSNCIDVFEYHHLVKGPTAQEHETIVFVKRRWERSSVDILQLLHNNEHFRVTFHFVRVTGSPTVYFELELEGAHIMAIEPWTRHPEDDDFEKVRIDYNQMRVTYRHWDPPGSPESYQLTVP
jgi:type VI secretion system Hcp family effector